MEKPVADIAYRDWDTFTIDSFPGLFQSLRIEKSLRTQRGSAVELLKLNRTELTYAVRKLRKTDLAKHDKLIEAFDLAAQWHEAHLTLFREMLARLSTANARADLADQFEQEQGTGI